LGKTAKGLIEAAQGRLAKAPRQGRAGERSQAANRVEAEPFQAQGKIRLKAQRRNGQRGKPCKNLAGGSNLGAILSKTGERMGRADRLPTARACLDPRRFKAGQEVAEQRGLAAKKMGHAAYAEQKPVRRIEGNERAIAAQRPKAQAVKRRRIGFRVGGGD